MQDNKVFKELISFFEMALNVLVIHRYEETARQICGMIRELNHHGEYAPSIEEAIRRLQEKKYDRILMAPQLSEELIAVKALKRVDKITPLHILYFFESDHKDKLKDLGVAGIHDTKDSENLYQKLEKILQSTPKKA